MSIIEMPHPIKTMNQVEKAVRFSEAIINDPHFGVTFQATAYDTLGGFLASLTLDEWAAIATWYDENAPSETTIGMILGVIAGRQVASV